MIENKINKIRSIAFDSGAPGMKEIINYTDEVLLDIQSLKQQLEELTEKLTWFESGEIHSCHANCQREACLLRRQLEAARGVISKINSESYLEPHLAAYELNVEAARWLEGNK